MCIRLSLAILCLILSSQSARSWDIEKISVPRIEGDLAINAYFAAPETAPPYPAVVLLHGCSGMGLSGTLSSTYSWWMRHLNSRGIAALAIDSAGSRGFGSTCGLGERRRVMYFERPGDAYSGLRYLQQRIDIQPRNIGLMGWSQGGGIALLTIVTKSVGRPEPQPSPDFAAAVAFYPSACSDRYQSEPFTRVKRGTWATVAPLLVLHGAKDNWTPSLPCLRFINAARKRGEPVEIVVYPEAAHSFDAANIPLQRRSQPRLKDGSFPLIGTNKQARADAIIRVSDFFQKHLVR